MQNKTLLSVWVMGHSLLRAAVGFGFPKFGASLFSFLGCMVVSPGRAV